MPRTGLDDLLGAYGDEATSGHYGVAVIETVDAAMGNEGVVANISPITMATIAALEVAAYEVLSGGDSLEALANLAVKTAMDLAGQLAAEALEAAADVIPVIGAAFGFLVGLQEAAKERARAERIEEARRDYAACTATAETFEPIGTGPFHEVYPCDLFLQAEKVHGGWSHATPPRVPYIGQMLRLMTETRWPGWIMHYVGSEPGRVVNDPRTWGYAAGPMWRGLRGSEMYPWTNKNPGAGDWFPELGWYVPEFARLASAIRSMHPLQRQLDGLPSADGGKSLWALYQDLLYAVLFIPRHPWTDPGMPSYPVTDKENFSGWVPALPRAAAVAMYGSAILLQRDGEPYSLGRPRIFRAIDYIRSQGGRVPSEYDARRLTPCGGQPDRTVEAVYDMAAGWNLYAHPEHYTEQKKQQNAIAQAAEFASEFARGRLRQMGITRPSAGGAAAARRTIAALAAGGVISPHRADEVASVVNGGADPGKLALYLGASAVGAGALAWAVL